MIAQPAHPAGEVRIDALSADDAPALLAFYRDLADFVVRAYRPYGWEITEALLREGPIARTAGGEELAVILRDGAGAIWGHAFLSEVTTGSALCGIGIHQKLLGQGLGRAMMTALLTVAETQTDLHEIRLTCVRDNAAAVRLYTSLGFERTREFIEDADGLPYLAMRKTLPH